MYEYKYVTSKGGTWYTEANHRELIDKYALQGWRFIAAIPTYQTQEGKIKELDLVFERKI